MEIRKVDDPGQPRTSCDVDIAASVIESPSVTTVAAGRGASTKKAPQVLDHAERMFYTGTNCGAAAVDPVADTFGQGTLAMQLVPVGLIAKHLAPITIQKPGHLCAVVHTGCVPLPAFG